VSSNPSKTQVDRLGERLKKGSVSDADLQALDAYRRTFAEAYESVIRILRDDLNLEPTGRPAKSTTSIADKLRREHIRLTQIQDIAGCRVVVEDIAKQDALVDRISAIFGQSHVTDRRARPSHGYRAVHIVVTTSGKSIEIQVRTALQHLWAEVSEKFSDVVDPAIKYGGGSKETQDALLEIATSVAAYEHAELSVAKLLANPLRSATGKVPVALRKRINAWKRKLDGFDKQLRRDKSKRVRQLQSILKEFVDSPKGRQK